MNLKQKLNAKQLLLGTFIKSTHYHNTEVLAHTNLDVLCLDAEHAPFDRGDLDSCIMAARTKNMPTLIRVSNTDHATLLSSLDIGADGLVLPHIKTPEQAKAIIKNCFYGNNGRGYAGSSRFAGYTTHALTDNLASNKSSTCIIAQIEDADALDNIEQLCQIDEIDCIFIGRMDLTISLGETNPSAPIVLEAITKIAKAAAKYNKCCGMFVGNLSELSHWQSLGVSFYLLGSDHSFLLSGAKQLREQFETATGAQNNEHS